MTPQELNDQIYHIVYLTTNKVNNKIYVGKHSTYNLNDGYLGSGTKITEDILEYGVENFERKILYFCLTSDDAFDFEELIVTKNFIKLDSNYNQVPGGRRGIFNLSFLNHGRKHSKETCEKRNKKLKSKKRTLDQCKRNSEAQKNRTRTHEQRLKQSNTIKNTIKLTKERTGHGLNYGSKFSQKTIENRSLQVKIISPNGIETILFKHENIMKFCKENNLVFNTLMRNIDCGKINLIKYRFKKELNCNNWEIIKLKESKIISEITRNKISKTMKILKSSQLNR